MSIKSFLLVVAGCWFAVWAHAADGNSKQERKVRILPVGESPPFLQEIRDGVRYELEVPPDSIPPREVVPSCGKDVPPDKDPKLAKDPQAAKPLGLHLGRISAPATVPAGAGIFDLKRVGEGPDAKPWLRIQRPEAGDFLLFLWRDPNKKSWRDALGLCVPDGPLGAPAGTVRIVNLFPQAVRILWAGEALMLVPGKTIGRTVKPGAEMPFQILVADKSGAMKLYYSGNVTQNPGERSLVAIYRADGVAPRRPVKVEILREPAPPPPPPDDTKKH